MLAEVDAIYVYILRCHEHQPLCISVRPTQAGTGILSAVPFYLISFAQLTSY